MVEKKQEEERCLKIVDQEGRETFKIGEKGEVFWFNAEVGDMVQAKTDLDLGKAMALVIVQLSGMDYVRLLEIYVGESTSAFRHLLIKKIMETAVKSKTIKKADLVKIINDFKI